MTVVLNKVIDKIVLKPSKLFLIDGFGALLSAFLLGIVLTRIESIIGMPRNVLYFLAFLPCIFAAYDFTCYFRIKENWRPFLKAIAFSNLVYCCISIALIVEHYQKLTGLGVVYFLLEVVIVICLVCIELKTIEKLTND